MTSYHPRRDVLDHGYVELIEFWGSDERIVETARVSTQASFRGWGDATKPGDEKLLRYLYEHKHSSPFEFAGLTLEVQAPILVFREWQRHRTQSYSEMSARYAPLPAFDYVPTTARCLQVNEANKQAGTIKGADKLTEDAVADWLRRLDAYYAQGQELYQDGLRRGVPKEIARLPLTVGRYSRMRATGNLRNWLAFLTLRSDHGADGEAAQWEIRQFTNVVGDFIAEVFPRTWALFTEK